MYDILVGRDDEDKELFGAEAMFLIGKHYVKMGQVTSLSNNIYMDVARSHVVFVCGKRGSGKCLTGDTLITLENGLEIPIKDLANNNENIMGLDNDLKVKPFSKSDFFEREVTKVLKIRLRSGKEITLTPEHPLLTLKGWVEAKDLSMHSRIATPRKLDCFGNVPLPEHEIKLLAYLISEGHTKRITLFSNTDVEIVSDFKDAIEKLHKELILLQMQKGCYKVSSRKVKRQVISHYINRDNKGRISNGRRIDVEKTPIRQFTEKFQLYGKSALQKTIPDEIFMLPKPELAMFLRHLFSCDGSIYKPRKEDMYWEVCYASSSKKMIYQIQSLLLKFEILCKIRKKNIRLNKKEFVSYEAVLDGKQVDNYLSEIGFFGKKETKQKLAKKEMIEIKRNPNIDTIPKELWNNYRPKSWVVVGQNLGYSSPKAARFSISYSPSRQKLLQIAIADNSQAIRQLAESDIFWDEIVSMETIEGNFKVYDISVPKVHNFVANNIIVHNSYTLGNICEGMMSMPANVSENLSIILLDTMGIFWTMKYENKKDQKLLDEWELKPTKLNVKIYTPIKYFKSFLDKGIPTDYPFAILPSELTGSDWATILDLSLSSPVGVVIDRHVTRLREAYPEFSLKDLISEIQQDPKADQTAKDAAENRLLNANEWGIFGTPGTKFTDLAVGGQVTVLDLSCYSTVSGNWGIKGLVVGLLCQKIFENRIVARKEEEFKDIYHSINYFSSGDNDKKKPSPLVWIMLDEAHELLPKVGSTLATGPLITLLREGRQPGVSLVLATQQPGQIHTDVLTQSDIVIAHRITAKIDIDSLGLLMQSYMRQGVDTMINDLPRVKGAALIFDDSNEKMYAMRVRPRITWHGGSAPSPISIKKKMFD